MCQTPRSKFMRYTCPVCCFPKLPYPPRDYHICPCCGTEFGNDDADFSYQQLREMWIAGGAHWFFCKAPDGWNPSLQLMKAGLSSYVHRFLIDLRVQANAIFRSVSGKQPAQQLRVSA